MSRCFGSFRIRHPWLGAAGFKLSYPLLKAWARQRQFHTADSDAARGRASSLRDRLERGETLYLLGIGPAGHNSGVALVEASRKSGVNLICNNEEERFAGIKHYTRYPALAIDALRDTMRRLGLGPELIHACLASWDYVRLAANGFRYALEELPGSWVHLLPACSPEMNVKHIWEAFAAPVRLGKQLQLPGPLPVIGLRHHDNHAYFSYAVSPFAHSGETTIVTVLDGFGDDGAISLYVGREGRLKLFYRNPNIFDSLGMIYSIISSTQGGWTILSSEGRYMGASAWGDNDRLTNPYYRQLRQLVYFGDNGQVHLNRSLANWHRKSLLAPYTAALTDILGPPIPLHDMWNPDAVLSVDQGRHIEATRDRVDKAAATQLLFEDVLFHVVGHLVRRTGASRLVLTGGTALNCVANMRLLEHFDESFYQRHLGQKGTRLHVWVPPTPGDAGVPMGAAYHFAMVNGARPGEPLQHTFYCGAAPSGAEIQNALETTAQIAWRPLGCLADEKHRDLVADLVGYIVSQDGVVGVVQGAAETGPRALGHRSILGNPCNPQTLTILNQLVKYREALRPLAPMATYEAAHRWFELSPGASDDGYNAYNYMVLTARARPECATVIPAVVHRDGTSRVQIVRREQDPFCHAYLKSMGRRLGVEVSVNTSLNVRSPIAQTTIQALETLKRSRGMHAVFLIGAEGEAFVAWHEVVAPPKDGGQRLRGWLRAWQEEVRVATLELA